MINILNYILKFIISFFGGFDFFFYIINLVLKMITKFLQIKRIFNFQRNYTSDLNLVIAKSGTMGDHLICIDCLSNFLKNNTNINTLLICRKKSIFPGISKFAEENKISLIPYQLFLKNLFKNFFSNKKFIKIDTEPYFRI